MDREAASERNRASKELAKGEIMPGPTSLGSSSLSLSSGTSLDCSHENIRLLSSKEGRGATLGFPVSR